MNQSFPRFWREFKVQGEDGAGQHQRGPARNLGQTMREFRPAPSGMKNFDYAKISQKYRPAALGWSRWLKFGLEASLVSSVKVQFQIINEYLQIWQTKSEILKEEEAGKYFKSSLEIAESRCWG